MDIFSRIARKARVLTFVFIGVYFLMVAGLFVLVLST